MPFSVTGYDNPDNDTFLTNRIEVSEQQFETLCAWLPRLDKGITEIDRVHLPRLQAAAAGASAQGTQPGTPDALAAAERHRRIAERAHLRAAVRGFGSCAVTNRT